MVLSLRLFVELEEVMKLVPPFGQELLYIAIFQIVQLIVLKLHIGCFFLTHRAMEFKNFMLTKLSYDSTSLSLTDSCCYSAKRSNVCKRVRLAGAWAWQPCAEDVGTLWWGCQLAGAKCAITIEYIPLPDSNRLQQAKYK